MNKSIALTLIKSKFQKHVEFDLENLEVFVHLEKNKSHTKWINKSRKLFAELEKDAESYSDMTEMLLKNVKKVMPFSVCTALDCKIDFIKKEIIAEMYYKDEKGESKKVLLNNVLNK